MGQPDRPLSPYLQVYRPQLNSVMSISHRFTGLFLGVGALTDFTPLIQRPVTVLLGAASQFGIFAALILALLLGWSVENAGAIGIIGSADGPTTIYVASKLAGEGLLAPVAVAAPAAGGAVDGAAAAEAKDDFDIELTSVGDKKINVIKVVRTATGLGLKEAKELVDGAPSKVKEAAPKAEAEEIKKQLEEAGATVTLK